MIKAIFFDVDGTLLTSDTHKVLKSTYEAINTLQSKGILCFMATGRHPLELKELNIDDISFDGYVTTNGQMCLDKDFKLIYSSPFKEEISQDLIKTFNEKKIPLLFIEENDMYHNIIDEKVINAYKVLGTSIPEVKPYSGNKIYQAVTYIKPNETGYQKNFPKDLKFLWWHNNAVDIISDNDAKFEGIKHICDIFNIKMDEVMAFGDAENDMSMLENVGVSIAMGNSDECVKEIADYITDDCNSDGIYNALKKYNLI